MCNVTVFATRMYLPKLTTESEFQFLVSRCFSFQAQLQMSLRATAQQFDSQKKGSIPMPSVSITQIQFFSASSKLETPNSVPTQTCSNRQLAQCHPPQERAAAHRAGPHLVERDLRGGLLGVLLPDEGAGRGDGEVRELERAPVDAPGLRREARAAAHGLPHLLDRVPRLGAEPLVEHRLGRRRRRRHRAPPAPNRLARADGGRCRYRRAPGERNRRIGGRGLRGGREAARGWVIAD